MWKDVTQARATRTRAEIADLKRALQQVAGCVQKTCFHREQNNQCSEEADSNGPSESDEMFLRRLLFQYMEAGGGDGLLDWGGKKSFMIIRTYTIVLGGKRYRSSYLFFFSFSFRFLFLCFSSSSAAGSLATRSWNDQNLLCCLSPFDYLTIHLCRPRTLRIQ